MKASEKLNFFHKCLADRAESTFEGAIQRSKEMVKTSNTNKSAWMAGSLKHEFKALTRDEITSQHGDDEKFNVDPLTEGPAAMRRLVHGDGMHGKKTFISLKRLITELSIKPDQKVKDFAQ